MLKFLFDRTSEPTAPTWHVSPSYAFNPNPFSLPIDGQSPAYKHRILWRSIWDLVARPSARTQFSKVVRKTA